MTESGSAPVLQLRVALTSRDLDRLVEFYCRGLGIEPSEIWTQGQARAQLLDMGKATLELFNEPQADMIDGIEAGRRVSGQVRLVLQVPDVEAAVQRLLAHGAVLVHEPVITPWGDRNARVLDPDGMQVTLFEAPRAEK